MLRDIKQSIYDNMVGCGFRETQNILYKRQRMSVVFRVVFRFRVRRNEMTNGNSARLPTKCEAKVLLMNSSYIFVLFKIHAPNVLQQKIVCLVQCKRNENRFGHIHFHFHSCSLI